MNLSKLCSVEPQLSSVVLQSPRPEDTEFILAGSLALEPSLEQSERVRDWVGLRPGRDSVRLGRERRDGLEIVHNYGHGGSGITVFQVRHFIRARKEREQSKFFWTDLNTYNLDSPIIY